LSNTFNLLYLNQPHSWFFFTTPKIPLQRRGTLTNIFLIKLSLSNFGSIPKTIFILQHQNQTKKYKLLAKINKALLPSFTKKGLDIGKASKIQ